LARKRSRRPISIGAKADARRGVRRMNSASRGLRPTVGLRRPERHSLRRRRPTLGAKALEKADFNRREGRRPARGAPNEFGLQGPSANGRPAPTGKAFLASAKADAWRESASEGRFQSAQSLWPTVGFTRRMNSTLRASGQRSACADRKGIPCVGEGRRLARKRLRRPISIGTKAFGQRSACADRKILSASAKADARRASASEGRFQSARRPPASGRLYASNEFDLEGPSANGRPAPTKKYSPRRRRPTPGAQAPQKADFNRYESLRPTVGLRRPERHSLRRRRPTLGAKALEKADFNRREGRRPARGAPNEFGLQGPSANGRPAPTGKAFLASAKADARRASASEGRFQSARRPTPGVGCAE
jgi:hypothetical protein